MIFALSSKAQWSEYKFSAGLMPGFLIAHRADLKNLETHMLGVELQFEQLKTNQDWTSLYREPVAGFGLAYFHLGRQETGNGIALQSNMRFEIAKIGNSYFQMRLGAGLGYLSKKFDPYTNRRNQAIGSHLNAFMQTAFLMDTRINGANLQYGFGISHFSNAAYKMPNLGFNLPSIFIRYSLAPTADTSRSHKLSKTRSADYQKRYFLSVNSLYAHKQRNFAKPVNFNHWGAHVKSVFQVNPIRSWRAGMDVSFDKTYKYSENSQINLDSIALKDQLELGLSAGHEWRAGNLRFIMELGAYIYKPADLKRAWYQRMGFIYNINQHWGAQGSLKFHRGVADYMEWGLVYSFRK